MYSCINNFVLKFNLMCQKTNITFIIIQMYYSNIFKCFITYLMYK